MTVRAVPASDVIDLRSRVLRAGMPRDAAIFDGDDEPATRHLAAFDGAALVGCVTILRRDDDAGPAWQLRGMAVAPERQRGGVGAALLAGVDAYVSASDRPRLWCNAREPAVAFYARHGWAVASDVFDFPTAGPHRVMTKELTPSPP